MQMNIKIQSSLPRSFRLNTDIQEMCKIPITFIFRFCLGPNLFLSSKLSLCDFITVMASNNISHIISYVKLPFIHISHR